jgi:hypothetical protein
MDEETRQFYIQSICGHCIVNKLENMGFNAFTLINCVSNTEHTVESNEMSNTFTPVASGATEIPMRIDNVGVCFCGRVMFSMDDVDTLGSDSGICCPDCGNEKFQTIKDIIDRQGKRINMLENLIRHAEGNDLDALPIIAENAALKKELEKMKQEVK